MPSWAVWEITQQCNLACRMCFFRSHRVADKELPLRDLLSVVANLPPTLRGITLTGGEPLLRPDIEHVCARLVSRGIAVGVLTNGYFVDRVENLVRRGLLQSVTVSLDGMAPIHNKVRNRPGSFERAVETVSRVRALGSSHGVHIRVVTVVSSTNWPHTEPLFRFTSGWRGVDRGCEFERCYSQRDVTATLATVPSVSEQEFWPLKLSAPESPPYSYGQFLEILAIARRYRVGILTAVSYHDPEAFYSRHTRHKYHCMCEHILVPRVDQEGNLFFCFALRHKLGSLLDRPLQEIWNSPVTKAFRQELLQCNLTPLCDHCYRCFSVQRNRAWQAGRNAQDVPEGVLRE